jgi:hypothetical protein
VNSSLNIPGFTAESTLNAFSSHHRAPSRVTHVDLVDKIVPAVPMPYCKTVCAWRVCGSALPGYPVPMCYSCEQECWIHDSGPYSRSLMSARAWS